MLTIRILQQIINIRQTMRETTKLIALLLFSVATIYIGDLFVVEGTAELKAQFEDWKNRYGKQYFGFESVYRYEIYKANRKKVHEQNKLAYSGRSNYFLALNEFAAMTPQQFKHRYGQLSQNAKHSLRANITTKCTGSISDTPEPQEKVNWTGKAVFPEIRTEGQCPANWAFSSVAAVEGIYAIKFQNLVKFSDQQLIDCSGDYGNQGCKGGFMEQAYWYMVDQGVSTEKLYPYNQSKVLGCNYSPSKRAVTVGRCAKVPSGIYDKMISAVVQQPVSVAIASETLALYSGGIYDGECSDDIDRGMLLVGYGAENGVDYWILKNTLGKGWGEGGWMRLIRTAENGSGKCGILLAGSVPQNVE